MAEFGFTKIGQVLGAGIVAIVALAAGCESAGNRVVETTHSEFVDTGGKAAADASASEGHPGMLVYRQACAACHDQPDVTRSPSIASLQAMSARNIEFALVAGKMRTQGLALTGRQRTDLIAYLTGGEADRVADWTSAMMCGDDRKSVDLTGEATVTHFGFDRLNNRALSARQAGLNASQLSSMSLAWAIAFPDATVMRNQGAVVGKNLFLPVTDLGSMFAFDLSDPLKPCIQWIYSTPNGGPLRTSASYGVTADGTPLLVFSAFDTTVHAVDARSGKAVWTKKVGTYSYSLTTGTPTVLTDRVIVPVAQFEISVAASNTTLCCTNHGYVLSLDPATGTQQWRYDTMEDAKHIRDRGDGQSLMGPSGAPIWNSPMVDEKRRLIYFATGEANSPPAHRNTNAVIAIGLDDGKERWSFQATPQDIYNVGCGAKPRADQLNCVSDTVYRDVDFGASVVLGKLSDGQELVYAGQKSGSVWAFKPETGEVVWRRALGTGGGGGGIHWGIAFSDDTIFAPIQSVGRPIPGEWDGNPEIKHGIYALDAKSGAIKWSFNPEPPASEAAPPGEPRRRPFGAMSAAPAVIDGVLICAGVDGTVYALDAGSGQLLWSKPTNQRFETINGVLGKGGAVDSAAIYAANGLLLVNSGYAMFGQEPGNVVLAFKPSE